MASTDETSECRVAVLVPHPSKIALLVTDSDPQQLPAVTVSAEPEAPEITRAVTELLGTPVTLLRANAMTFADNFDATSMVIEIEPLTSPPPQSLCWTDLEGIGDTHLGPDWATGSVVAWLRERRTGWSDLRPQWSRPGWLSQAGLWMREQMQLAGYDDPGAPQIRQVWGMSVVLAADSASGTAYLKASGQRFLAEAAVTRALSRHSPGALPDVIAVDLERGWLLMRDINGPILGDQPPSAWGPALDALHDLQRQWLDQTDALLVLGAESRPLSDLAAWVTDTTSDDALMSRLSPSEQAAWQIEVPTMVNACSRLAEIGPGVSLVHGDFHPWNAASASAGVCIFDWSDASVGHPFVDVVTYVTRAKDPVLRQSMIDRYLALWQTDMPGADLNEVGRLSLVVGSLYQAQTYWDLIPTVMPDDRGQLHNGDIEWLRRAQRFASEGVMGKY